MKTDIQIENYIKSIPEPKKNELTLLHEKILELRPGINLWYFDGTDEKGKLISNPNIGYGSYSIHYANGKTREFYRVGLSANQVGISVYIMGIKDKNLLFNAYNERIGKAKVTGYCIKFKTLKDIDLATLIEAVKFGLDLN